MIISCQGGFFARAINSCFKEGNESVIDVSSDEPELVEIVLGFYYGISYSASQKTIREQAQFHAKVYGAGDFYALPGLKDEAYFNFVCLSCLTRFPEFEMQAVREFIHSAPYVYTLVSDTDQRLKEVLVHTTKPYIGPLAREEACQQILHDLPQFAIDLLASKPPKPITNWDESRFSRRLHTNWNTMLQPRRSFVFPTACDLIGVKSDYEAKIAEFSDQELHFLEMIECMFEDGSGRGGLSRRQISAPVRE